MELEDRVHAELLENPALEEGKEESTSDETTLPKPPKERRKAIRTMTR